MIQYILYTPVHQIAKESAAFQNAAFSFSSSSSSSFGRVDSAGGSSPWPDKTPLVPRSPKVVVSLRGGSIDSSAWWSMKRDRDKDRVIVIVIVIDSDIPFSVSYSNCFLSVLLYSVLEQWNTLDPSFIKSLIHIKSFKETHYMFDN